MPTARRMLPGDNPYHFHALTSVNKFSHTLIRMWRRVAASLNLTESVRRGSKSSQADIAPQDGSTLEVADRSESLGAPNIERTVAQLLEAYQATYPQKVRDVAETFCAATTRLAGGRSGASRPSLEDVQPIARKHAMDVATLAAAIADYSTIEQRAEAQHRVQRGKLPE